MKKILLTLMALAMTTKVVQAKTLVVYYSFTNNCRTIATDLKKQLSDAELVEVQPAEDGLDYAANNYAIGKRLIQAIRDNPNDASSYPTIKNVAVDFSQYDDFVIVTPLWWSNMAAPMQTFLFQNGMKMANKKVGLIVSSASSGISDVVADAKRLIPNGDFTESLWIRSFQVSNCHSMIAPWISSTGIGMTTGIANVKSNSIPNVSVIGNRLIVNGEFKSVGIYDTTGRKLLSSLNRITDINGIATKVLIAIVRRNDGDTTYKFAITSRQDRTY